MNISAFNNRGAYLFQGYVDDAIHDICVAIALNPAGKFRPSRKASCTQNASAALLTGKTLSLCPR